MHVYLSPHFDDICFSLGGLASREGGDLINIFTRSSYVAKDIALPEQEDARAEAISRLRDQEDRQFAEAARLKRHDIGLWEPALMGWDPFDLTSFDTEVAALSARLLPLLLAMLPGQGEARTARLYCPMGIGGHRNHLSTLVVVRRAYDVLRERCTIFLYEDLHYASASHVREQGVELATRIFSGKLRSPTVLPLDAEAAARKVQLIGLYASQHARPPLIGTFTPASGLVAGPHEVVWQVSEPVVGRSRD